MLSLLIKGIHALVEVFAGLSLYLFGAQSLVRLLYRAQPVGTDQVSALMVRLAADVATEHQFYAYYLIVHGFVNGALALALLLRKRWACPATFAVLTVFIAYQTARYASTHDTLLLVLNFLDLMVIGLTWNERRIRSLDCSSLVRVASLGGKPTLR